MDSNLALEGITKIKSYFDDTMERVARRLMNLEVATDLQEKLLSRQKDRGPTFSHVIAAPKRGDASPDSDNDLLESDKSSSKETKK